MQIFYSTRILKLSSRNFLTPKNCLQKKVMYPKNLFLKISFAQNILPQNIVLARKKYATKKHLTASLSFLLALSVLLKMSLLSIVMFSAFHVSLSLSLSLSPSLLGLEYFKRRKMRQYKRIRTFEIKSN